MKKLLIIFKNIFSLDLRSLALYRVITGLVLLYDLINRSVYLKSHYTSEGVLPISELGAIFQGKYFSLHVLSDTIYWQAILFFVTFVFALAFTLGYKTKLASIVSWILLLSLQNRNPLITYGADVALLASLFWGMFLPLGERWSIDSKNKKGGGIIFNTATVALVVQVFSIFIITGFFKLKFDFWNDTFQAVEYVLHDLSFVTPMGDLLLNLPTSILKALTLLVLIIEIGFPFLFVFGFIHFRFKLVSIFGLVLLLLVFGCSLFIGIFPLTVAAMLLALLPPEFWKSNKEVSKSNLSYSLNPILQVFLGFIVFLTFAFNTMYVKQFVAFPKTLQKGLSFIGLTQYWIMFSPPSSYTRWPIVKATFKDGTIKNLLYPEEKFTDKRPERFGSKIWNERWQAYFSNIGKPAHFKSLTNYYVKKFANPINEMEKLEILYLYQNIQLDSINRYGETYKYVYSSYNCYTKEFQSFENGKLN